MSGHTHIHTQDNLVSRSQTVTLAVTVWTTAVERFVLSSPEVGWALSASGAAKGMNLITRLAWSTLRYIHLC